MTDKDLKKRFGYNAWQEVFNELYFRFKFGIRLDDVPTEARTDFGLYVEHMFEKHRCGHGQDSEFDGG